MDAGSSKNRRVFYVITILVTVAVLDIALFGYLYYVRADSWSFVEKNDGTILLGKVELLEGGYLKIDDVYQLVYTRPEREQRASEQFQLEAFGSGAINVIEIASFDSAQIGPAEVKQWGAVPQGSKIEQRLIQLETLKEKP